MKKTLIILTALVATVALSYAGSMTYLLTSSDAKTLGFSFQYALENNPNRLATDWVNLETGLSGTAVPLKTYRVAQGQVCRDYFATVQLDGEVQQAFGTACRLASGQWKVVSEQHLLRDSARITFAMLQPQKRCPHMMAKQADERRDYHSPQLVDPHREFLRSGKKRYHSEEFFRQLQQLKKNDHPQVQPRKLEKNQPSKLIRLVDYQPENVSVY